MKLFFISPSYYPHIGGVEYVVKSVAERLSKKGHNVIVLCGNPHINDPRKEDVDGVSVIRWPVWSPGNAYHIPKMRSKLEKLLLEYTRSCDIIHFHSIHSILTVFSLSVLRNCNVHKVLTPYYHGTGHTFIRKILWKGWRIYVKKLLPFIDVVHTVSRLEAQLVKKDFGVDAISLENGVEEWMSKVRWSPLNYVMYSGRIEKYKNIHRLANIVKILNNKYGFDLELRVYGSGSYVNSLIRYLDKTKIKYYVEPLQPFERYIETLSKASLFGLLSEKESYPQSVNEANAIGVPVVVAEPWGQNFSERNRTLITKLSKSDDMIAKDISIFLDNAKNQPKSVVPSWDQVVETYMRILYVEA